MELKQIGSKTFCIEHDTNIGIHFTDDGRMYLIDTGSKGDGEKIDEILSREGWVPSCIINTHTHIDHIGGNEFLMRKYGIPAYCTDYDMAFAHYSELEAAYMNGGYPAEKLRTIFAHPGMIGFRSIEKETPDGIDWTYLPGHSFGMIGIRTSDDIWFLGDSYLSRSFLNCRRSLLPRIQAWMHLSANILRLLCSFLHWSAMCSRIRVCVAKQKKKSRRFATTTRARRKSLTWRRVVQACLMSVWMACRKRSTRPRRLITPPWNREARLMSSSRQQRASKMKRVLRSIRRRSRRNRRKATY